MGRIRRLEPKAREMIKHKLFDAGEIRTEEVVDLIRPHYQFDPVAAKERELKRMAHQMMSSVRDEKGDRSTFACNVAGVSKYVNVDKSNDLDNLRGVDEQLRVKLEGLKKSSRKASNRRMEVEGQMSLDLTGSDKKEDQV